MDGTRKDRVGSLVLIPYVCVQAAERAVVLTARAFLKVNRIRTLCLDSSKLKVFLFRRFNMVTSISETLSLVALKMIDVDTSR